MQQEPVKITVELTPTEAWAYAQHLKRATLGHYAETSADDEVYDTMQAGEKIRRALAEKGYAPR